jgi:hypothetical protein
MSTNEWAGLAVATATIVASFAGSVRWLVKHYLTELKQNSGSSLRDSVDRLERQVEEIYRILLSRSNS